MADIPIKVGDKIVLKTYVYTIARVKQDILSKLYVAVSESLGADYYPFELFEVINPKKSIDGKKDEIVFFLEILRQQTNNRDVWLKVTKLIEDIKTE